MNSTVAVLVFALAALVVVVIVLWRAVNRGTGTEVSLSFLQLFDAKIKLDEKNTSSAQSAVRQAAEARGQTLAASPKLDTNTRLARLLWVDDNPDNNFYESVALEQLGRFITKTTSTESAMSYLDELSFSLIITDVRRGKDPKAGETLIRQVRERENGNTIPIVVYTIGAAAQRDHLLRAGADAVVDMPNELVREVNARLGKR